MTIPTRIGRQSTAGDHVLGYELDVSATSRVSRRARIEPGVVPDLRMRVTPVVVKPGETVTAQLIRGPEFKGSLPAELEIACLKWKQKELKLDDERRTSVTIDPSVEGWCEVTGGGVRGLVYVRPQAELAVTVAPKQPQYNRGSVPSW
jgi:hypothetical protein